MQQVSTNDNGNTFVSKINSNFAEVSSSLASNVPIPLIRGGINSTTGLPDVATTTVSEFTNKLRSVDYIKIIGTVDSLTFSGTGTATIYCFNASFAFLGTATNTTLQSGTVYIRIGIVGESAYQTIPTLSMTITGQYSFVKSNHAKKTANFFCFETTIPKAMGSDGNYYGSSGIHYDQGFIKLPPNYTHDGTPVPLVLYFPGSNGYQWGETSVLLYDSFFDFICDNGYAVACCSGLTDYWMDSTNNPFYNDTNCKKNSKWSGTVASAFCHLYDYIERTYNIRKDGVYVFGKSTGGMGAAWFSLLQPIKVRCAGLLAPSTFMVGCDMRYGYVSLNVLKQWNLMLGCPNYNDFISGAYIAANSDDAARLVTNAPYYKQWEPFTQGTDIDLSSLLTECAKVSWNRYSQTPAVSSIITAGKKHSVAPTKIWQSVDDDVIDYYETQMYKGLIDANNGICDLRTMPSNAGKHHSVDTDANAPKVNYTTKYNGVVNIAVAYAELVDWFNRW